MGNSRLRLALGATALAMCLVACGLLYAAAGNKPEPAAWHQWRGPTRNGISAESKWKSSWGDDAPKRLWTARVGSGYSGVSVRRGRVYTMGADKDTETVYCLNAGTGAVIWKHSYPAKAAPSRGGGRGRSNRSGRGRRGGPPGDYSGPRATPALDGDTVFTVGRAGQVVSIDTRTGKPRWAKNIQTELGAAVPSWGVSGSPLVFGKLLILSAGRCGVALDKETGAVVWQVASPGGVAYASPVPFRMGDTQAVAFMAGSEIVAARMADGEVLWRHPWKPRYPNNCADPIFSGDRVFISSAYGAGSAVLGFSANKAKVVWKNKEMNNHFSSCVLVDGHLYGFDGDIRRGEMQLKCIEFATGKTVWAQQLKGSLIVAGGRLVILTAAGDLVVAEASPKGYKMTGKVKALSGQCWTAPVLSGGRVYCRNQAGELVCMDVSG